MADLSKDPEEPQALVPLVRQINEDGRSKLEIYRPTTNPIYIYTQVSLILGSFFIYIISPEIFDWDFLHKFYLLSFSKIKHHCFLIHNCESKKVNLKKWLVLKLFLFFQLTTY